MLLRWIHISDLHLHPEHVDETKAALGFIHGVIKQERKTDATDMTLHVVVTGDIFRNRLVATEEEIRLATNFFGALISMQGVNHVVVIAGNHDVNLYNSKYNDHLAAMFSIGRGMCIFKNRVSYLDNTGVQPIGPVVYIARSVKDRDTPTDLVSLSKHTKLWTDPRIGAVVILAHEMFHCSVVGTSHTPLPLPPTTTTTATSRIRLLERMIQKEQEWVVRNVGVPCAVMCGDIHKPQDLTFVSHGAYAGSLMTQDLGEGHLGHGLCVWKATSRVPDTLGHAFTFWNNPWAPITLDLDAQGHITTQKPWPETPRKWRLRRDAHTTQAHIDSAKSLISEHFPRWGAPCRIDHPLRAARRGGTGDVRNSTPAAAVVVTFPGTSSSSSSSSTSRTNHAAGTALSAAAMWEMQLVDLHSLLQGETPEMAESILQEHVLRQRELIPSSSSQQQQHPQQHQDSKQIPEAWMLEALEIQGVLCFGGRETLRFQSLHGKISGIRAPNGMGKSCFIDAIYLAVFGDCPRVGGKSMKEVCYRGSSSSSSSGSALGQKAKRQRGLPKTSMSTTTVSLVNTHGGRIEIKRFLDTKTLPCMTVALVTDQPVVEYKGKVVDEQVRLLLGQPTNQTTFHLTDEVPLFLWKRKQMHELLGKLWDLDRFDAVHQQQKELCKALQKTLDQTGHIKQDYEQHKQALAEQQQETMECQHVVDGCLDKFAECTRLEATASEATQPDSTYQQAQQTIWDEEKTVQRYEEQRTRIHPIRTAFLEHSLETLSTIQQEQLLNFWTDKVLEAKIKHAKDAMTRLASSQTRIREFETMLHKVPLAKIQPWLGALSVSRGGDKTGSSTRGSDETTYRLSLVVDLLDRIGVVRPALVGSCLRCKSLDAFLGMELKQHHVLLQAQEDLVKERTVRCPAELAAVKKVQGEFVVYRNWLESRITNMRLDIENRQKVLLHTKAQQDAPVELKRQLLQEARERLVVADKKLGQSQRKLDKLKTQVQAAATAIGIYTQQEYELEWRRKYTTLLAASGLGKKQTLRMKILDRLVGDFNKLLQDALQEMGCSFRVVFDDSEFKLINQHTEVANTIKLASGQQRFAINLAIRAVLQQLTLGPYIDAIFVDEGFGCLDKKNLEHVQDTLRFLQEHFSMVCVVSHLDAVVQYLDVKIELYKPGSGCSGPTSIKPLL